MDSSRSWLVFAAGVFGYLVAVMERSTVGVAGVAATERFHSDASLLSMLAVLQLAVYATMQVPVGVLIDRIGPRTLILTGTVLMAVGQFVVAFAGTIGIAVVGRVLVGAGDAMIFTSLIRLVGTWFSPRRVPQLTQWVANIGQLGQILSAVPFALLLHQSGWSMAFASAAGLAVVAAAGALACIRDRPADDEHARASSTWPQALRQLRESIAHPGTQLGFWVHFSTQSSGTVFTLMWGYPYLVTALGYSPAAASALLTLTVVSALVVGPFIGWLTARFPLRRSNLVLGVIVSLALAWAVVLAWPGVPPVWLVIVLLVVIGIGGPGAMIGLDFARTFNPAHAQGSANGFVNIGGFSASFAMIFLIGLVLDAHAAITGGPLYSLNGFRLAFCVQFLVLGLGVTLLLAARRRARRRMHDEEGIEVGPLWVALRTQWSGRLGRGGVSNRSRRVK